MNRKGKLLILLSVLFLGSGNIVAQDGAKKDSPWSVGADLVSRYVWRGMNIGGSSPSIQPSLEYAFGSDNHAFTVGAWGAYSLSDTQTGQEADLYLSYTFKDLLTVMVFDYFFPDETVGGYQYFNYNMDWVKIDNGTKDQTKHLIEAAICFNGTDKIPVSLLLAMNVWGMDSRKYAEEGGVMVAQDGIVMSKYIEIGYSKDLKGVGCDVFAGFCLDSPNTHLGEPTGFYGQKSAGLINLGVTMSKEVSVTDNYSLPVSGSLIINPSSGNIFMVIGISF